MQKKTLIRIAFFGALLIYPILAFDKMLEQFQYYLTGNVISTVIQQQWHVVVISIVAFLAFLIPLSYRRKAKWAEYGLVTAFFVSLFVEMYGIPLTILFASKYFGSPLATVHELPVSFNLFGIPFGMSHAMVYAAAIMAVGALLIITGWVTLYRAVKKKKLVTTGIYAYSRHPQYLGFIMVIVGWVIGWPTYLTLVMGPILVYKYIRVCKQEEKDMSGKEYEVYRKKVPLFI